MVKLPFSILSPLPKVEVADVDCMSRVFARSPPEKVEVASVPVTMSCCPIVVVPAMSAVDEAENAPATLNVPAAVEEAAFSTMSTVDDEVRSPCALITQLGYWNIDEVATAAKSASPPVLFASIVY